MRSVKLYAFALAAVVVAVYWRALGNGFVNLDDDSYVLLNEHVKNGVTLDGLRWAFTDMSNGNWHPLTWISHMLDVQWFGMDAGAQHLMSILWHAANSIVLLALLWSMTRSLGRSTFVAALFALHPLRVESVAWISERKDVLSGFFYLATLCAYVWYTRKNSARRYWAVVGLLSLGLMAKASVVTAPLVLLLLDYWPLARKESWMALVREKIPLFVLAGAVSIATYLGQQQAGAMTAIRNLGFGERVANALVSYVRYLGKIFWPHPLAVLYPYERGLPALLVIAACALLIGITVGVLSLGRKFRYLPVGWFWFLITMAPMIGLVQVGWQAYADRYTYIPSIGILIAVVWMAADRLKVPRQFEIGAATAIAAALALVTWLQLPYWHDDLTLFQHAVDVTHANPFAEYHVGDDLAEAGRNAEAIPYLEEVTRLEPRFYAGYYTLGKAQAGEGKTGPALDNFAQALKFKPDYAEAHYARALTLLNMGDMQNAEPDFRAALQDGLRADYCSDAHNGLGIALAQRGELSPATVEFEEAVRLKPDSAVAQRNLAFALANQGRVQDAIERLKVAISATHGDEELMKMLQGLEAQH